MSNATKTEWERATEALYRDLRLYDFLATLDDTTIKEQARWAAGVGLTAQSLARLLWMLGGSALLSHGTELDPVIAAITGAPMSAFGGDDELPF